MLLERRRSARQAHRWMVEVIDLECGVHLEGVTRDIGLFGCFVETTTPLLSGRTITLKIAHGDKMFTLAGEVSHAVANEGMGIAFGALTSSEYGVLKRWLKEEPRSALSQQSGRLVKV